VLGGAEIEVTDANKADFVKHFLEHKLGRSTSFAVDGFAAGLTDLVAADVLLLFNADECQDLLGGQPGVNWGSR
jgi:hypothetical protein